MCPSLGMLDLRIALMCMEAERFRGFFRWLRYSECWQSETCGTQNTRGPAQFDCQWTAFQCCNNFESLGQFEKGRPNWAGPGDFTCGVFWNTLKTTVYISWLLFYLVRVSGTLDKDVWNKCGSVVFMWMWCCQGTRAASRKYIATKTVVPARI